MLEMPMLLEGPSDSPSFPVALGYMTTLVVYAVVASAIGKPSRSALNLNALAGWMISLIFMLQNLAVWP
jgi:hypothetical protein